MEVKFRSCCMIASALDLIGDKWSLLIIRDMLLHHKTTFKDFVSSNEGIATNLLSSRLKLLESIQVITKNKLKTNKKENIYLLTEKGLDLSPIILELAIWSDIHAREYHKKMNVTDNTTLDKNEIIEQTKNLYKAYSFQFKNQIVD